MESGDPAVESSSAHFRAWARQAVSLPGALRAAEAHVTWNRDVRIVDLGLGGACVEASDSPAAGTPVELVIDTPHLWDPLTLSGAVVWSRRLADPQGGGALIGVCFSHATGSSARTLTELLEAEAFG
ncbi:MAG TPA: PilZ domain-containing protein [Polyangiaceae bacterium]|nr:PilZ domain-containing protein [Polyangiaceae bacterium]